MTELTRGVEDALIERADQSEGRRLDIRLLRWGDVAKTADSGSETFARGAFAGVDPTRVTLESQRHGGPLVGVGESLHESDQDAVMTFRVASTPAGDELLTLAREGVLRDASVVFRPIKSRNRPDGVIERQGVDLLRVALLERGAYPSAGLMAVREEAEKEETQVTDTVDLQPVTTRLDGIESRMTAIEALSSVPAAASVPELYRCGSLGEFTGMAYRGEINRDALARALADQVTTNNAGIVPPAWLSDVKRIVNLGRRGITAFGGPRSLPATGMEVDWPYLNSSNTIIGEQATQKTEVTTARVDIAKGSATLVTYAGGSDISYQLLQRSSPSYREAYDRIMLAEWGKVTDAAFCAALEAASGTTTMAARGMLGSNIALANPSAAADDIVDTTGAHGLSIGDAVVFTSLTGGTGLTAGRVYWVVDTSFGSTTFRVTDKPGGTAIGFSTDITAGNVAKLTDSGQRFREALFQASVAIEDATGQPAGVILAATDVFLALSGLSGIVPPQPFGAPSYPTGVAEAATLRMEASGLTIIRTPGVSAGKVIVSNSMAAAWHEDGPKWVTADDVAKLGQNVAVYSFAAPAVFVPAGVVELTLV